jgi:hypothetical protein
VTNLASSKSDSELIQQKPTTTLPKKKLLNITERPKPEKIRVELNIEKWPAIWQLAKSRNKPALRILEREVKLPDGSKVVSRVEISFNHLGTLTTEEQKMFYGLIKHWEDSGRSDTQVFFSDRHLARILQKGWGTNVIESTTKSLRKLRSVSLEWIHSYYDKTKDGLTLRERRPFTILSELRIIERAESGTVNKALGYFKFDDHILRNLLANYTKPFLIEEFFKIKSDIGLLLYNHVDLILYGKNRYERSTKELFSDLGLNNPDYTHMHKRKRAIEGALKELQGLRISSGIITLATIEKTQDKKDYKVIFQKSSRLDIDDIEPEATLDTLGRGSSEIIINNYSKQRSNLHLQAEELVRHFYKVFHGVENDDPPGKAIDQATTLLTSHGFEKAKYVIEYSHAAAESTNFKIQHFGAVLSYASRAIADFDRMQHDQSRALERQQHEAARVAEEEQRRTRGEQRLAVLTPEQYQARFEQAKQFIIREHPMMARLLAGRESSALHDGAIRARMIQQLDTEEMSLLVVEHE